MYLFMLHITIDIYIYIYTYASTNNYRHITIIHTTIIHMTIRHIKYRVMRTVSNLSSQYDLSSSSDLEHS